MLLRLVSRLYHYSRRVLDLSGEHEWRNIYIYSYIYIISRKHCSRWNVAGFLEKYSPYQLLFALTQIRCEICGFWRIVSGYYIFVFFFFFALVLFRKYLICLHVFFHLVFIKQKNEFRVITKQNNRMKNYDYKQLSFIISGVNFLDNKMYLNNWTMEGHDKR